MSRYFQEPTPSTITTTILLPSVPSQNGITSPRRAYRLQAPTSPSSASSVSSNSSLSVIPCSSNSSNSDGPRIELVADADTTLLPNTMEREFQASFALREDRRNGERQALVKCKRNDGSIILLPTTEILKYKSGVELLMSTFSRVLELKVKAQEEVQNKMRLESQNRRNWRRSYIN